MKKVVIISVLLLLTAFAQAAPSYTTSVVPRTMTFQDVIINYNVTVFDTKTGLQQLINSLTSAQPNGAPGTLSTSCSNVFTLQQDDNVFVWVVMWSKAKHDWSVKSTPLSNITTAGKGTVIFSKK